MGAHTVSTINTANSTAAAEAAAAAAAATDVIGNIFLHVASSVPVERSRGARRYPHAIGYEQPREQGDIIMAWEYGEADELEWSTEMGSTLSTRRDKCRGRR